MKIARISLFLQNAGQALYSPVLDFKRVEQIITMRRLAEIGDSETLYTLNNEWFYYVRKEDNRVKVVCVPKEQVLMLELHYVNG